MTMKIINTKFLLFVSLYLLAALNSVVVAQSECQWSDPSKGVSYNFQALKRSEDNPWVIKHQTGVLTYVYRVNICGDNSYACRGYILVWI